MRWTRENPTEVDPIPAIEEEPVSPTIIRRASGGPMIARLSLLWDERRFIVKMVIWGMVCSALLALLIPKRWESTTRLMPPDSSSSEGMAILTAVADKAGSLGPLAGNLLGMKNSSDMLVGILRSNTLADRLIGRFDLKKYYGQLYQEDARDALANRTAISIDRKSGILSITVTDKDPVHAAALANAYVDELNKLTTQLSTGAAHRERVFLEDRLTQVSKDLEVAEKNLSQFSSKNATLNPQDQGKAMVEAAAGLQGRLIEAQAELEGMRSIYTDNSMQIRAIRAEIASLEREIQRVGGKPGEEMSSDSNQLYPSLRQLPLLGMTWTDLYRQAKIQEAVYETLTKQYELAKVQEAKETPTTKVLDPGERPQKKSFPPRTLITLLGGIFTFCFAVLWVLGSARWDAIDPESPGKMLATQVWATITAPVKKIMRKMTGGRISWNPEGKFVIGRTILTGEEKSDGMGRKED